MIVLELLLGLWSVTSFVVAGWVFYVDALDGFRDLSTPIGAILWLALVAMACLLAFMANAVGQG